MLTLPPDTKIRINGFYYRMVDPTFVKEGDRVLDLRDGCHGICDKRIDDRIAIRDGCVIELAVPLEHVKLLEPIGSEN